MAELTAQEMFKYLKNCNMIRDKEDPVSCSEDEDESGTFPALSLSSLPSLWSSEDSVIKPKVFRLGEDDDDSVSSHSSSPKKMDKMQTKRKLSFENAANKQKVFHLGEDDDSASSLSSSPKTMDKMQTKRKWSFKNSVNKPKVFRIDDDDDSESSLASSPKRMPSSSSETKRRPSFEDAVNKPKVFRRGEDDDSASSFSSSPKKIDKMQTKRKWSFKNSVNKPKVFIDDENDDSESSLASSPKRMPSSSSETKRRPSFEDAVNKPKVFRLGEDDDSASSFSSSPKKIDKMQTKRKWSFKNSVNKPKVFIDDEDDDSESSLASSPKRMPSSKRKRRLHFEDAANKPKVFCLGEDDDSASSLSSSPKKMDKMQTKRKWSFKNSVNKPKVFRVDEDDDSESCLASSPKKMPSHKTKRKRSFEDAVSKPKVFRLGEDDDSVSSLRSSPKKMDKIQAKRKSRWIKKHSCLFCSLHVNKMSRHLLRRHSTEPQVAKVLALPKGSIERRREWGTLLNKGDFEHNIKCFKGELEKEHVIPKYTTKSISVSELLPCTKCKGLYQRKYLTDHIKKCLKISGEEKQRGHSESKSMLPISSSTTAAFRTRVLDKMREGPVKETVLNDQLIVEFGTRKYGRRDVEEHTSDHVSNRMRELGRLLLLMRKEYSVNSLHDVLKPDNKEKLVEAVKFLAGFDEATHKYTKASLARRLGFSLKKCAEIKKVTVGLKDDQARRDASQFLEWFQSSWCDFVSSSATQSLQIDQFNKEVILPQIKDVSDLYYYAKQAGSDAVDTSDYQALCKATMCELLLFNRKRSGEIQRFKKAEFAKIKKGADISQEIANSLTKLENHLAKSLSRIEVRGKFNRKVAILMTDSVIDKITVLLDLQNTKGRASKSKYVFATPDGERPYRTCDVVRQFSLDAGVKNPAMFRSVNLRKHIATLSQCLELTEVEQDILAQFLGHDLHTHRHFYRLPMDILQKAKIGAILLQANGLCETQNNRCSNSDQEASDNDKANETFEETKQSPSDQTDDITQERDEGKSSQPGTKQKHTLCQGTKGQLNSTEAGKESNAKIMSSARRKKYTKHTWTSAEQEAVLRRLRYCLIRRRAPQKHEVEDVLQSEPVLAERTWRNIKDFISHRIRTGKF